MASTPARRIGSLSSMDSATQGPIESTALQQESINFRSINNEPSQNFQSSSPSYHAYSTPADEPNSMDVEYNQPMRDQFPNIRRTVESQSQYASQSASVSSENESMTMSQNAPSDRLLVNLDTSRDSMESGDMFGALGTPNVSRICRDATNNLSRHYSRPSSNHSLSNEERVRNIANHYAHRENVAFRSNSTGMNSVNILHENQSLSSKGPSRLSTRRSTSVSSKQTLRTDSRKSEGRIGSSHQARRPNQQSDFSDEPENPSAILTDESDYSQNATRYSTLE